MSALIQAIKAMKQDYGTARFSFSNGALPVHIDIEDPDECCMVGDNFVTFEAALEHLAENEQFIRTVV